MAQIIKLALILFLFFIPVFGNGLDGTFASYLEKDGDISDAIVEYERLVVDSSMKYNADSLHLRIAKLYIKLRKFGRANEELDKLSKTEYINNLKGISYLLNGDFDRARSIISNDTLKGISYILQDDLTMANRFIKLDSPPGKKYPILGAIMSSIIPGSGKFYAGRSFDGIYSFLLVLSPVISSYFSFRDGNKTMGYIYGSIGGMLYLGNIYGSYKACEIYNRYQSDMYKRKELIKFRFEKWF